MNKTSTSKIALITGGSHGIGKAVAARLCKAGLRVIVADVRELEEERENLFFRKCDVSSSGEIDELYAWVQDHFGTPDILFLNAGQGIKEKLTEGDPEKWQKVLNVNLMGALRCIRSFVPDMLSRQRGNIVFTSSVSANQPHEYGGIYSASKTALEVVAETLRLETMPHLNITVVAPGIVDTPFYRHEINANSSVEEMGMGAISPEEIAEDIWYALNKASGTSINKIITRPIKQRF